MTERVSSRAVRIRQTEIEEKPVDAFRFGRCAVDAVSRSLSVIYSRKDPVEGAIVASDQEQRIQMTIDRRTLVLRHNVIQETVAPLSPLTVGNGRFCYTADVTGLQTLRSEYGSGSPLSTMAEWGWN